VRARHHPDSYRYSHLDADHYSDRYRYPERNLDFDRYSHTNSDSAAVRGEWGGVRSR